jgi:hypothetical protein
MGIVEKSRVSWFDVAEWSLWNIEVYVGFLWVWTERDCVLEAGF